MRSEASLLERSEAYGSTELSGTTKECLSAQYWRTLNGAEKRRRCKAGRGSEPEETDSLVREERAGLRISLRREREQAMPTAASPAA